METSHHEGCFVICEDALEKACDISLNAGVAYAVLAAGTGRDHITTAWSAEAIANYSGMNWRRAKEAVNQLRSVKIITKTEGSKTRPRYRLRKPQKNLWIPVTLITGAQGETPPIARVRQIQQIDSLFLSMALYGKQNLIEHGGLPRDLVYWGYDAEKIMTWSEFNIMGFCRHDLPRCKPGDHPLPAHRPWDALTPLLDAGLIEWVPHLAESEDGEMIHALTGDSLAREVSDELERFGLTVGECFDVGDDSDWIIPLPRHMPNAAVIGVARMRYRPPKTRMTSMWWSEHATRLEASLEVYKAQTRAMTRLAA